VTDTKHKRWATRTLSGYGGQLRGIRSLQFRRKRLSLTDVVALCDALMCETNRVSSLEFNGAGLGVKNLARIAEAIEHPHCRVTRLCIFNEHVGPVGARLLARLIAQPKKSLMSLILENNVLSSEGAVILADALKQPTNRLHVLYLLNNHIGQEGIAAIANALKHENNRIVELSLTGNYLGLDGLGEVAQVLKHPNNRVEYLRLGRNRIDNRGACILAKALVDEQAKVKSLDLETNLISDTRDLTRAMKISKLQWVDLSFNMDNPYDQTRMFCEIRVLFFEKKRYWMSILAMCCAREAPTVYRRFLETYAAQNAYEEKGSLVRVGGNKSKGCTERKVVPGSKSMRPNMCYLCILPKDLIKLVAAMTYPWPRTEKMLSGFVY